MTKARQKNTCNLSKAEAFEISCGARKAFVKVATEGAAFRKLMHRAPAEDYGMLARFRVVQLRKGSRFQILTPWFYQDPVALLDTK